MCDTCQCCNDAKFVKANATLYSKMARSQTKRVETVAGYLYRMIIMSVSDKLLLLLHAMHFLELF